MDASKYLFSRRKDPFLVPLILIALFVLFVITAFVPLGVVTLLQKLVAWTSGHIVRQIGCTLALGLVGFGLHEFRTRAQVLYGMFEMFVALTGFWYALGSRASPQASAAAIIAGLYVFVRGLDNYRAGITEQHRRMGLDDQHRPLPPPISEK
jgi:hypothetical protein